MPKSKTDHTPKSALSQIVPSVTQPVNPKVNAYNLKEAVRAAMQKPSVLRGAAP